MPRLVDVYWNLKRDGYSIRDHGGKVFAYAESVYLVNARMVVRASGHKSLMERGGSGRYVHAWITGELVGIDSQAIAAAGFFVSELTSITYCPWRAPCFVERESGRPIHHAMRVALLTRAGKANVLAA
jgi:hypothetical protein